jgi:hypothetical protein
MQVLIDNQADPWLATAAEVKQTLCELRANVFHIARRVHAWACVAADKAHAAQTEADDDRGRVGNSMRST